MEIQKNENLVTKFRKIVYGFGYLVQPGHLVMLTDTKDYLSTVHSLGPCNENVCFR